MRKLNAKGVVKTAEAFGTASHKGSQHASAMAAFQTMDGVDAKTGGPRRADLAKGAKAPPAPRPAGGGGGSQRAAAMAALTGKLEDGGSGKG